MDEQNLRFYCQQFRSIFMDISGGLCPFYPAMTIARLCSAYWQTRFLEDKQIAIIPRRSNDRFQSKIAIQWLEYGSQERHSDIQRSNERHQVTPSCGGRKKILYHDVTSLYPFVNRRSRYPFGYYQRISEEFQPLDTHYR